MARQAMIIDMDLCVGCGACVLACQEEWELPDGVTRNWVRPLYPVSAAEGEEPLYTHDVGLCHHCREAPCLEACPTGATGRDDQGRVVVDAGACIGCGYCAAACPYGARTVREDVRRVEKCDFCAPLVDAGERPACVSACPAGARIFGDLDDRQGELAGYFRRHEVRRNESDRVRTDPQVFYAGRPEVVARVFAEHPPDPGGLEPPLPGRLLGGVLRPAFLGLLGLVLTGQLVAVARQLTGRDADAPEADVAAERMLRRHDTVIMVLHWLNALAWLLLAVTGAGLLASSAYSVTPGFVDRVVLATFGSPATLLDVHIVVGLVWAALLLFYGLFGLRRYLLPYLRHLRIDRTDWAWLRLKARRMLRRSGAALPPQGKYNAGQKLFGWAIALSTVVAIGSGLVMALLPGRVALVGWAIPVHFAAAAAGVVALAVHLFMTTAVPSERPTLWSMLHGRIPESYARENNRAWWERVAGEREEG